LLIADCWLLIADCLLLIADCLLLIVDFWLLGANSWSSQCLLLIANCCLVSAVSQFWLLIAVCWFMIRFSAECWLLIADCCCSHECTHEEIKQFRECCRGRRRKRYWFLRWWHLFVGWSRRRHSVCVFEDEVQGGCLCPRWTVFSPFQSLGWLVCCSEVEDGVLLVSILQPKNPDGLIHRSKVLKTKCSYVVDSAKILELSNIAIECFSK